MNCNILYDIIAHVTFMIVPSRVAALFRYSESVFSRFFFRYWSMMWHIPTRERESQLEHPVGVRFVRCGLIGAPVFSCRPH